MQTTIVDEAEGAIRWGPTEDLDFQEDKKESKDQEVAKDRKWKAILFAN